MKQQNYNNHQKWVVGYHLITFLAILFVIIGSIMNLVNSVEENLYSASLLVLVSFILLFLFYFIRAFALKVQDRVIKTEESFRYYLLTGKQISANLTVRQLVGLRFASDEEFVALCKRAEEEQLSEKDVKKAIKNWRKDSYRA